MHPAEESDVAIDKPAAGRQPAALAAVIGGAFLFGASGVASKELFRAGVSTLDLATVRSVGAALLLWLLTAVAHRRRGTTPVTRAEIWPLAGYAITGFVFVPICYYAAIRSLPIAQALIIEYLAPAIVAAFVVLTGRERPTAGLWLALGLAFTGLCLVTQVWRGAAIDVIGIAAALGAAVALAASFLLGKAAAVYREPLSLTAWAFTVAAISFLLVNPLWKIRWSLLAASTPNAPAWLIAAGIILLGSVVSYLLLIHGLRRLSAASVGLLSMLEPVFAALLAWLTFGERLARPQLLGAALVLGAVVVSELNGLRRRRSHT